MALEARSQGKDEGQLKGAGKAKAATGGKAWSDAGSQGLPRHVPAHFHLLVEFALTTLAR